LTHFKLHHSTKDLPESWDLLPVEDVFLKTSFLKALEASSPANISTYFLGVYKAEVLVGIAVIQHVEMYVDDMFRKTSNVFFKRLGKLLISKIVKGNALIVGNLMHTGQHGLYFNSNLISQNLFLTEVWKGLTTLSETIKNQFDKKIRIVAFKDYFENDPIHSERTFFQKSELYKTHAQPNMIFEIKDSWSSTEAYISAFNKKYRRRYKTARKKSQDLECKELMLEDLNHFAQDMYSLYENVSDNAGVNSFKLHKNHFCQLKKELKDDFKIYGYFKNSQLIGFYSFIKNYDQLETYFLGYNQELQHQHQMYLNMLFDMASFGIEHQFKAVVFARTAMEIKSSIGAKPHKMNIYVKHTNNFIVNRVLKLVVKYANPVREWEERHPFT
jgi:hypothetical protein